ncbi:hypothetical protein BURMUCGD2M_5923 [Burkholderia multivorans CGD2M]|uniref:Uncharacterized protein n=1 Tax=Burkholderia multivorans CGD2 TaxID=513052 RepID=B9BLH5_9BURK|nr:hypothetical protein BURMUCGD2_5933 [Burkholderia multivorans CGD2]EEE16478.1 hypothetical protein BURMUCGD2M_5923 [Burkholderia multivorans CGD2M]
MSRDAASRHVVRMMSDGAARNDRDTHSAARRAGAVSATIRRSVNVR